MCFSADASFTGAAVIAVAGVSAVKEIRRPQQVALGVLPLAFAIHQATEGIIWLGLDGDISSGATRIAAHAYAVFAWALLPVWVPLALLLIESGRVRRRMLAAVLLCATPLFVYMFVVALRPVNAHVVGHSIAYTLSGGPSIFLVGVYLLATCGALFMSSNRTMLAFACVNVVGVAFTVWLKASDFTSLWCTWAAFTSLFIWLTLRRERTHSGGSGSPSYADVYRT